MHTLPYFLICTMMVKCFVAFIFGVLLAIIPCELLFCPATERHGVQCVRQAIATGRSAFVVGGKLCLYLWRTSIHCCYEMQRPLVMTSEAFTFERFLGGIWFLTAALVLASGISFHLLNFSILVVHAWGASFFLIKLLQLVPATYFILLVVFVGRSLLVQIWQSINAEAKSSHINSGTFDGRKAGF